MIFGGKQQQPQKTKKTNNKTKASKHLVQIHTLCCFVCVWNLGHIDTLYSDKCKPDEGYESYKTHWYECERFVPFFVAFYALPRRQSR